MNIPLFIVLLNTNKILFKKKNFLFHGRKKTELRDEKKRLQRAKKIK